MVEEYRFVLVSSPYVEGNDVSMVEFVVSREIPSTKGEPVTVRKRKRKR